MSEQPRMSFLDGIAPFEPQDIDVTAFGAYKVAGHTDVGADLVVDFDYDRRIQAAIRRNMADAMLDFLEAADRQAKGLHMFGPTRADYNAIMRPIWRRERIAENVRRVMPGRRHGQFIRA